MQLIATKVRPFLKWAGGKSQLISQITPFFPPGLQLGTIKRYVEPFIGGGAVFFYIANHYEVEEYIISDVNEELILAYKTIKKNVEGVLKFLSNYEEQYLKKMPRAREKYFYDIRSLFNDTRSQIMYKSFQESWIDRTAQIIFLNKTCFNGLFRVNSNGGFNVPFGAYKNPSICNTENLLAVSNLLKNTKIYLGDFSDCERVIDENTFVYFDPPYRPISKTSNFTSYSKYDFDDAAQLRLASFYRLLDKKGAKLMLSNSDPKNENIKDNFFEQAYKSFQIERVKANRMINCDAQKRSAINELLIINYGY